MRLVTRRVLELGYIRLLLFFSPQLYRYSTFLSLVRGNLVDTQVKTVP